MAMKAYSANRLFGAGFLATLVMSVMIHPLFSDRLPNMELATMVGSLVFGEGVVPYTGAWWLGVLENFFNGTFLFPLLYSVTIGRARKLSPVIGGLLWGALLWVITRGIILPLVGYAPIAGATPDPSVMAWLTLFPHCVYGLVFGATLGFAPSKTRRKSGSDAPPMRWSDADHRKSA